MSKANNGANLCFKNHMSNWGSERLRDDARWKHGIPPVNNANYAWIQHFIHHLSPTGIAAVDGVCSTDIFVAVPKADYWHSYVLSLVSSKAFFDYTDLHSAETKMPRIRWKDMSRYPLASYPFELDGSIQNDVAALHQCIAVSVQQNHNLAGLRDKLLPNLLSGALKVPDAEELMGSIA